LKLSTLSSKASSVGKHTIAAQPLRIPPNLHTSQSALCTSRQLTYSHATNKEVLSTQEIHTLRIVETLFCSIEAVYCSPIQKYTSNDIPESELKASSSSTKFNYSRFGAAVI
jgi:hypothetical protein